MTLLCLSTFISWSAASSYLKDACSLVMVWLVFYAAYVFLVAVHETGHLVAGAACGFRTQEFRVGCLRWRGGWGFDWRGINVLSGWVNMQLTRPDDALRLRRLLYVTAGPLANLACAALLYPIAVHQSTSGGLAKYLFLGNILFAVANLIPMKAHKVKSDGLQILSTLFDQAGFEALRFHIRCQEAAPTLQKLKDKDDWLGVKQLAEHLLSLSAEVRAEEKVVKSLDTVLRFADSRLAGAAIADGK